MRRLFSFFLCALLLAAALPANSAAAANSTGNGNAITILFTHDLHSNLLPFTRTDDGTLKKVGGFARLATLLQRERADIDALVVDAGDFSMGTLFQTIYASHASELRLLGKMGYDAVTLGNHEFDFGTPGLVDMLNSAANSQNRLPQLLFNAGALPFEDVESPQTLLDDLSDAFHSVGAQQTMLIEKNGIKIGLFSAFGEEATEYAPTMAVTPPGIIKNAKAAVKALKAEGAELIICLSHSGTSDNPKESEDELLAAAVPEIDVIISGHTHTYLYEPIQKNNTFIVSCGEYGQYLGKLVLKKGDGVWELAEYELLPVDESVADDATIASEIAQYKAAVEQQYLVRFGNLTFDEVIARSLATLKFDVYEQHGESPLGNLIADAYIAAAAENSVASGATANGTTATDMTIAVVPAGTIRWGLAQDDLTLADVFNVNALGIGPDELSGYPLIDVYLTGEELYNVAEVDASVTPLMSDAQLFLSGLSFTFNPNRLIFNRVTQAHLVDASGKRHEIEKDTLYRVVCGLYSAQMLGSVKDESFGILSIVPKDAYGNEITDFEARILRDQYGTEIKEWYAIAKYVMSAAPDTDGIPLLSEKIEQPQGRKIVDESKGLGIHFRNLNGFSRLVYGIVVGILLLLAFVLYFVLVKRKRRRHKRKHHM